MCVCVYIYSLLDIIYLHYYTQEAFALPLIFYNLSCFIPENISSLVKKRKMHILIKSHNPQKDV